MADLSVLRDQYRQEKQALWAHIANSSASGRGLKRSLGRLARLADVLLSHLWRDAGFEHGEALIAVGGYGRGELFPSSDVDVLVLLPNGANTDDTSDLKSKIEAFIGSCWDSGLEIGSSVRTLQDWRRRKTGPSFVKLQGWAVRYPLQAVIDFEEKSVRLVN